MKNLLFLVMATLIIITSTVPVIAKPEFSCADVNEIPLIECEALVELYKSTNGLSWTQNTYWLVTNTPSDWLGVTISSGHVTNLAVGVHTRAACINRYNPHAWCLQVDLAGLEPASSSVR
jgi:hypothetical protein